MNKKRSVKTVVPDAIPCPCCGNAKLHVGRISSDTLGVVCARYNKGCGLRMHVDYPDVMPKGIKDIAELDRWCLEKAISKWNRRKK